MRSTPGLVTKPRALTPRQTEVLQFLRETIQHQGYSPTVREIGRHMKIKSPNGVLCHLKALEKKGYIRREGNRSRAIQLIEMPGRRRKPMLRELKVSEPLGTLVGENWLDFDFLFAPGHFVLQICGTGWIKDQLVEGDFLVLRKGTASVGDCVVVNAKPNEMIVSHAIRGDQELRLSVSESQSIAMRDAEIFGVVVGVIRRF